jgi:crotonobetainyl-CoA:carnitine CoA-transferase CaiB-like acyl-CoA transferase
VVVCAIERQFWEPFCSLIGRPDLIDRHSSEFPVDFGEHDAPLYKELQESLRARTAAEWGDLFAANDVPCCPVFSPAEAAVSAHGLARGIVMDAAEQGGLEYRTVARGLVIDGSRGTYRYAPPRYGQHTDEILSEIGYPDQEIVDLRQRRVVS